ncbi:MAG: Gfo/Idh/MocA family oxidoreductase [Planctomycetota bacterium]|nr:Gfo/Idh/MocA family oxidoreductase [Planctomycetota bacterium]
MNENPLKLGVVGCGWAGRMAVDAGMTVPRTTVAAIAEPVEELRNQTVEEYGVTKTYTDYRQLLDDKEIEAVYLAVNPPMRYQMVLDSFDAGKHVLVQKPHAVRAPEILEFETKAKEVNKTLQFCYFMRHYPHNRRIRAAVAAGEIGDAYHARIWGNYRSRPEPEGITKWLQVYGQKGGVLGQHYSHELDLAWFWMGCPKPEWAFGIKHSVYPLYDGPEGPAEDYYSGIVGLAGGKTIQIDCTRWLHTETPTVIELYGSTGAIAGGKISRLNDDLVTEEPVAPTDVTHTQPEHTPVFYYEIEHFAMAVAGEVEPDVNAADSYQFMKILDGLYDSARDGRQVSIE